MADHPSESAAGRAPAPSPESSPDPAPDPAANQSPTASRAQSSARPPDLPPAARRALAEAAERRRKADAAPPLPVELGGREGPEPVRYGDYEKKGLAVDF